MTDMVDNFLNSVLKTFSANFRTFVAFLFFVFSGGMLFGLFISQYDPVFLFLPPALGLLAYYNEKIALLAFVALIVLVI
ncbi:MAG: hypothetical protein Q7R47_06285 [Candidatus Diapherotrites archaeon]|nr:hypothetical protein [Candidatus Diapherotrites archaeon]